MKACGGITKALAVATAAAMLPALASPAGADTRFVDDDAAPGGDGLTWATSYRYLQDALYEGLANPAVTEIRVAGGFYAPDQDEAGNVTPGDRDESFSLKNDLTVSGAYRGLAGGGDPDDRDLVLFPSVLTGDLLGDDGPNFTNNNDNSFHVVEADGTDETAVLDGVVITAGNARGAHNFNFSGGGMFISGGDGPEVFDCRFEANQAWFDGGGLYIRGSDPEIDDCRFIGNDAGSGGGVAIAQSAGAEIFYDMFESNTASRGAGLYCIDAVVLVHASEFHGNTATTLGGGMHLDGSSIGAVCNSVFDANTAAEGGGIRISAGSNLSEIWGSAFCGNVPDDILADAGFIGGCNIFEAACPGMYMASGFSVLLGMYQSGDVDSLETCDDDYVVIEQRPAFSVLFPLIRMDVSTIGAPSTATRLQVTFETGTTAVPTQPPQKLSWFSHDAGTWEVMDNRPTSRDDAVGCAVETTNADRFIETGTGAMKLRLEWFDPGNVFFAAWTVRVDEAVWAVTP